MNYRKIRELFTSLNHLAGGSHSVARVSPTLLTLDVPS